MGSFAFFPKKKKNIFNFIWLKYACWHRGRPGNTFPPLPVAGKFKFNLIYFLKQIIVEKKMSNEVVNEWAPQGIDEELAAMEEEEEFVDMIEGPRVVDLLRAPRTARRVVRFPDGDLETQLFEDHARQKDLSKFRFTYTGKVSEDTLGRIDHLRCMCGSVSSNTEKTAMSIAELDNRLLDFARDGMLKLSFYFGYLEEIFRNPDDLCMMMNCTSTCQLIKQVCNDDFETHPELDSDNGSPLAWFLRLVSTFMTHFHTNRYLVGQKISKEWLRYDMANYISVPAPKNVKVADDSNCVICQDDFSDRAIAYGFQRRCNKYPFPKAAPCEGHTCGCVITFYHLECLSDHFFSQEENKTFAKCATCNAEWCLHDVVSYKVKDAKRNKKRVKK
jgi:hypothetical protein